jgi:hypothetical protein
MHLSDHHLLLLHSPCCCYVCLQAFTTGGTLARAFVYVLDRVGSLLLPNWLLTSHGRNVP